MNKQIKVLIIVIAAALIGLSSWYLFMRDEVVEQDSTNNPSSQPGEVTEFTFGNPKKSAHYESNTPAHGAVLAGVPVNIVIDFNFDLAPPSDISIKSGGQEYGLGGTIIDGNNLAMRRKLNPEAPNGLYEVTYEACWPDGSCHDGSFQFAIDRARTTSFTDMRGQPEVTIRMSSLTFNPSLVRVSKGSKVTWINDDTTGHFVNTDSHPAHTYLPGMNSRSLAKGASYSFTFSESGLYPYHCSAHAATMTGSILVE